MNQQGIDTHFPNLCFLSVAKAMAAAITWTKIEENRAHRNTWYHISEKYNEQSLTKQRGLGYFHNVNIQFHLKNKQLNEILYLCNMKNIWLTYLLTYLLTYSMEQSPSWAANWFSASQEIPCISWNPNVHYHIYKFLPHFPILSQINPVRLPHPTSWRFILILSSHLWME